MTKMQKRRYLFGVLLILFFIIFTISGYKVFSIIDDSKSTNNNLIYSNESKVNYTINIDENEFIKPGDLAFYDTYINSLVQNIDMTMQYKYEGSEKLPLKVTHHVIATIYGQYNKNPNDPLGNPIMWKKDYIIVGNKTNTYDLADEFEIKETFNLDWRLYNQELLNFMANLSLPTVSYLEVNLEIDFSGSNDKYNLGDKQIISARMPLNEQVFNVDSEKENKEEKFISSNDIQQINRDQRKLTAYIILLITSLVLVLITIKQIFMSKDLQPFSELIDEIKKDYDEIIIETKNMIETKGLKPVNITSFDEMLNLADSLLLPIMLYQEAHKAVFYIVKSDMIYVYSMKNIHHKKIKVAEE